ncbi:MAG: VapE domain-containing protein [Cyanobacteria bacterium P01_H01_bin.21]
MKPSFPPFNILHFLDQLEPDEGSHRPDEGSYFCPVCHAKNFKINLKTGKYKGFSCVCTETDDGKRAVIEAIVPPQWQKPYRQKQKRAWTYCDQDNRSLIRVHRMDDGEGSRKIWQESLQEGTPAELKKFACPYRYEKCLETLQNEPQRLIFWVEGEPCADALWEIGIAATTTLGGSVNYCAEQYRNLFPAESLVLCPDRDLQGLKYAEEIATDYPDTKWCYAYPDSPLWNHLSSGGGWDIADWIEAGATKDTILAAVGDKRGLIPASEPTPFKKGASKEKPNAFKRAYHFIDQLWAERLRFNDFTKEVELEGNAIELSDLKVELAITENLDLSLEKLELILGHIAKRNRYHPVKRYLMQCFAQYSDTDILDTLAQQYFGCEQPIYNAFLKRTLIAAVARVFEPGCKVDTVLILQGKQGFHKSSFFKSLVGAEYFDDSLGAISDKDEKLKLHKTWVVEWAELESVFKRKDIATTKAFLSSSIDVVRPPYNRQSVRMERQSIIVGTTNQDEFLSDVTGNRRFWVIPVQRSIGLEQLKQDRDLIWGAAVALYKANEQWWLTPEEEQQAEILASDFLTSDPWQSKIAAYLSEHQLNIVTTNEILNNCLEIELAHQTRRAQMRVADCLKEIGWEKTRKTYQGKQQRVWIRLSQPKSSLDPVSPKADCQKKVNATGNFKNDSQPRQPTNASSLESYWEQNSDNQPEADAYDQISQFRLTGEQCSTLKLPFLTESVDY